MFHANRLQKLVPLLVLLSLVSVACSLGAQTAQPTTAPTSAPAPTHAPVSQPTAVPPTAAPTAAPTATPNTSKKASFNQFSFNYDLSLATDVTSTVVPGFTDPSAPEFAIYPDYTEFNFVGYQSINTYHQPHIAIYAVADYEQISDFAKTTIADLKTLLANQPADPGKNIPFLPIFNAAQVFHSQVQYLKFTGGHGLRFVTQFDQAAIPLNNLEIIYTFQGLTDDGKYYISAILPVTTSALLNSDQVSAGQYQAFNNDFQQYLQDTVKKLDALTPADFSPKLNLLDAVIQSLQVQ